MASKGLFRRSQSGKKMMYGRFFMTVSTHCWKVIPCFKVAFDLFAARSSFGVFQGRTGDSMDLMGPSVVSRYQIEDLPRGYFI